MAEIVFSCDCGLILKVYGADQSGSEITCPSCKNPVIVPIIGEAVVKSPELTAEAAPPSGHKTAFLLTYLSVTVVVTIGLVKFLLLPALERPAAVARVVEPSGDSTSKKAEETISAPKKPRVTGITPRKTLEPDRKFPSPSSPSGPGPDIKPLTSSSSGDPGTSNPVVDPGTKPDTPVAGGESPGSTSNPGERKPSLTRNRPDRSPYAHITNSEAKEQLELTLAVLKRRDPSAISTAELFLNKAERAAVGDSLVEIEIKKLRARISAMRVRKR